MTGIKIVECTVYDKNSKITKLKVVKDSSNLFGQYSSGFGTIWEIIHLAGDANFRLYCSIPCWKVGQFSRLLGIGLKWENHENHNL